MKQKHRVYILVKAYPQPSQTYEETVCCAGVTEDGQFIRLYPIRYRHLAAEAQFDRFDLIELEGERPRNDHRPESFHVYEDSIKILRRGRTLTPEMRLKIWLHLAAPSLGELRSKNQMHQTSLGIVQPDSGSVKFSAVEISKTTKEDQSIGRSLFQQQSLIEDPLKPLQRPEYAFYYSYKSGGLTSKGQIHDWEVQATYYNYKSRYREGVLDKMADAFGVYLPKKNLHLILGTMKAHPRQFIIIGLLRTSTDTEMLARQSNLFS